jgi:phage repressor protein C with HTH and peptisase S24 domain
MPLDVPVLGTAVGGSSGDFTLNNGVVDYARRPPGVARNKAVFCVFVRGDSMEPRFEAGDLLYINPARPARNGDDVLVEMHPDQQGEPGAAYIKRLEGQTPTKLILRQFNPTKRIEIPIVRVLRVCPILRTSELLGL